MAMESLGDVAAKVLAKTAAARRGIEILRPSSREEWLAGRMATLGASEIPALFGVSPYLTPFELFAVKIGAYARDFAKTEIKEHSIHLPPTERGNFLESKAFELTKMLRPTWTVEPNQIPGGLVYVDRAARMSSTPDAGLIDPARPGRGSLQVKSIEQSVFRRTWQTEDGAIEPPIAVAVQAIIDATLSGCDWACAGAMVCGFNVDFYLVEVPLHAKLMAKARDLVADFWDRVEDERPYAPDFARDGALIASLYADDDGGVVNLTGSNRAAELVARREVLKATEAKGGEAEKERRIIDTELISLLGNAARGMLADGRVIEAKTVRRKGFSVEPTSFRAVKIKENSNGFGNARGYRPQQPSGPSDGPF